MSDKKQRIGIIGFGGIARSEHYLNGYKLIADMAEVTAVCDIKDSALQAAKEMIGLDDSCLFKDYKELIASGLVDAVDICTPNYVHCEIAHAAIKAGLPFSIEKPIGLDYKEAYELEKAVKETNTPSFVCFSWRYRQYTRYVRDIIKSGSLGRIYHIYIKNIKDSGLWPGRRLEWRFDKARGGSGVLGDLGSHMVDITRFWGEEFDGVFAQCGTFIKNRKLEESDETGTVTTDDWCNINAMTKGGIPVTISLSRVATTISNLIEFEVMGENGRIKYTYDSGKQNIEVCIGDIDVKGKGTHNIIPPASYNAIQSKSFVNMLNGVKDEYTSELVQGMECQRVLEAAAKSIEQGRYVKISEIEVN